jgi:hypothetical protein
MRIVIRGNMVGEESVELLDMTDVKDLEFFGKMILTFAEDWDYVCIENDRKEKKQE